VAATRIISIIGRKNAGKTTLTVALAAELGRRGRRVMTMKHSDSWRHFHEGRAERTLLVGPELQVLFHRSADTYDPMGLAREHLSRAEIVLAEGFKGAPLPKIEVFRPAVSPSPLYDPESAEASRWAAIVTDDPDYDASCMVLRFQDTMWLQLLANLAWDRALALEP
jgi:molybdopterin-guanine dinucleotide biosynthesis protein MobB